MFKLLNFWFLFGISMALCDEPVSEELAIASLTKWAKVTMPQLLQANELNPLQADSIDEEFQLASFADAGPGLSIPRGDRIYFDFSNGRFVFTTGTRLSISKHTGLVSQDGAVKDVRKRVVLFMSPKR